MTPATFASILFYSLVVRQKHNGLVFATVRSDVG